MLDLWYTENHTKNVKFSIKISEQIHHEVSEFQVIDFFKSEEFGTFFTLDGLMMVNEKDEFTYHDMISHVPMATNPSIKKVLVIGGGDGGTVRELTRYKHIEQIDMVEIDEAVVRACQKFLPITAGNLEDKRVNLYFEDGVAFVKDKKGLYDLILVDSTDPIGPGEGLFTRAFYQDCFDALTENGILVNQHESPYYERDAIAMKKAHNKLKELFPVSKVYQFHMPTYPSGHWLFGFASKKYDPIKDLKKEEWEALGIKTKYYNTDLHVGSFALPSYVKEMLEAKE
jgi:spermidine synthase